MAIPILRVLTMKSKLGFGTYGQYTLTDMFALGRNAEMLSAYYHVSNINYNQEVLNKLKLTEVYQIEKPGTDKDNYKLVLEALYPGNYRRKYENTMGDKQKNMTRSSKNATKGYLMGKNRKG
jgi:hypothetical protein